jgi:Ca2+/Na+ antiporter
MNNKWIKVTALALGYPSLILSTALFFNYLIKDSFISKTLGLALFFVFVILNIFLIVLYTYKKND